MNEHAPFWNRFNNLTPEAALALLRAKLPNFICLACGGAEMRLLGDPTINQHSRVNFYQYPAAASFGHVPTLAFACENCGYVHSFERLKLDPAIEIIVDGFDG